MIDGDRLTVLFAKGSVLREHSTELLLRGRRLRDISRDTTSFLHVTFAFEALRRSNRLLTQSDQVLEIASKAIATSKDVRRVRHPVQ